MKRLLWIGDACVPSGFARATHQILDTLKDHYEITVLGINYRGDPHSYPYPVYACAPGGDSMGFGRLIWMCDTVKPDVIVIQQDPWHIPGYMKQLQSFDEYKDVPVIGVLAVDGKNLFGPYLNGLSMAIFWTQFGMTEAIEGGYQGISKVIPLGVDLDIYKPMDQAEARWGFLPDSVQDGFIIGNVNRNQPRKRWDLTLQYFAEWYHTRKPENAFLYLHTAPTGDQGIKIQQLATYYKILDRLILHEPPTWYGLSEELVARTYNCFDLQISTTQGEGFGLTTFEGMACGVPQIVPDWSALGELCDGAAWLIPCTSTHSGEPFVNVIGGVPDKEQFIRAINTMYSNPEFRKHNRQAGLERVRESRFRWSQIGERYLSTIEETLMLRGKA